LEPSEVAPPKSELPPEIKGLLKANAAAATV
jgi:hypothetical protein